MPGDQGARQEVKAMATKFVEVFGREYSADPVILLYAFPINQWTEEFSKPFLEQLKQTGVTDIEVRFPAPKEPG